MHTYIHGQFSHPGAATFLEHCDANTVQAQEGAWLQSVVKPVQVITSGSRPGGLTRTDHRLPQAEAGLPINEACSAVPFLTPAPQPTAPPDPRRRRVSQLAGELRTVIHGFAFLRFARSFAPGPDDNVAARGIPSVNPP